MDNVKSVSCGGFHTGVISTEHKLYMVGNNRSGQLGTGESGFDENKPTNIKNAKIMDNVLSVSCGGFHTGVVKRRF